MAIKRYICAEVAFDLPVWFPPDRLDWSRNVKYGDHHAWAGTYSHTDTGNSAVDALFRLKGMKEFNQSYNCVVEFYCRPSALPNQIRKFEQKLERFLNRYRESKDGAS